MEKKTINKLLKIIIITLVISYGVDKLVFFGLNKISDQVLSGQSVGKLNHFLSIKDSVDILVFGNSRANHHINTEMLGKSSFNMGVDGSGIGNTSTLINTLDKNKKQLIVVHIDTKNFFNKDYVGSDIGGLKIKYKRNTEITETLNKSGQISLLHKFYYSINYNGKVFGIFKNYFSPSYDFTKYNGYDPLVVKESQQATRDAILKLKEDKEDCQSLNKLNPIAMEYLQSIKEFSDESNKTFLFITSPSLNNYCKNDNTILAKTLGDLGFKYVDSSDDSLYTNNNDLWKDKTHMSDKGANLYTQFLVDTFKEEFN